MLVLDANILIRAVLGSRVLSLLRKYGEHVPFLASDTAFEEAGERLPGIRERRILDLLAGLVQAVEVETYEPFEDLARERIARRDEDDWPVLAAALALKRPIWTEDTDFFGCGVATWTSDRVELYLASVSEH
jgi:predicted nucleic acid-binding protein